MKALLSIVLMLSVALAFAETNSVQRMARITSKNTFYDHKQGVVIALGDVHVDDDEYEIWAEKAYAFTEGTNGISRIVAIGHVAMTNGTKRAYGAKVSYHRKNGMVVLHSGNGQSAEVRDEEKGENRVVRGSKIRFWIDAEQVEVLEAEITAPSSGLSGDDLKNRLKGN